ncbi:MAG: LL-diaminopimelate aminotransferase [Actinomycetota bacterium]
MEIADRIKHLPPYLFAEIDRKIAEKKAQGIDVISLGIGDPVEPTPPHIVEAMCRAVKDPANHGYPSYFGLPAFREAIARWYDKRFGVRLDPETEILPLIGSKEGLAHIFTALVDPGDVALVPDPGYPVYEIGSMLSGGQAVHMPLLAHSGFNPDFDLIEQGAAEEATIMLLNYPNNPTAAIAGEALYRRALTFGSEHKIAVCHDFAYSEITFDGYQPVSILAEPGAMKTAAEFHSLSKTYNMTGWRIGWLAGCPEIIEALGRVKTNIDSGIFNAIQLAGVAALDGPQECVEEMRQIYQRRRDKTVDVLQAVGVKVERPKATVFVWAPVPEGHTSSSFATLVLEKAGVVVSPGNAYGPSGEGYVRLSLTVKDDRLEEALDRIQRHL